MKPTSRNTLALIATMGAIALAPQQAFPREEAPPGPQDGFQFKLGAGVIYGPQYKGSSDYEAMPLPFVSISYTHGERYIAFEGLSLRANVLSGAGFEFGPLVSFEFGRDDDVDNLAVSRLPEIDDAVMAGAFARKEIDLGDGASLQVSVEVLTDTGDVSEGTVAKFEAGYNRLLGERWMLMLGASTTWADENYMRTYYGVTRSGSAASGLARYAPDSGFEGVELSTGLLYRVSDQWSVMGRASYQRLLDSAADSPIVQEGSEDQMSVALAIVWEF